jgi:hypothetical protein
MDDVDFRPDPPLYREASVPVCIRSDISAARPDAFQYSIKLQILSKFIYGKIDATVRTTWIPVWTPLYHRLDARASDMEIVDSTSTVQMPAFLGPDARTVNMEIEC